MPETQQNPRSEGGFPLGLFGNDLMHQMEEAVRVVLDLDVNVELDVLVFRL